MSAELLTNAERDCIAALGKAADLLRGIVGDGPQAENDWAEAAQRIHGVQHMVMAQAAARAYPKEYRLLGEVIPQ